MLTWSDEGRIRVMTPDGDTAYQAAFDVAPRPLGPEDRDRELGAIRENLFGELEEQAGRIPPELDRYFQRKFERALSAIRVLDRTEAISLVIEEGASGAWVQLGGHRGEPEREWIRLSLSPEGPAECRVRIRHTGEVAAGHGWEGSLYLVEMEDPGFPVLIRYDTPCP